MKVLIIKKDVKLNENVCNTILNFVGDIYIAEENWESFHKIIDLFNKKHTIKFCKDISYQYYKCRILKKDIDINNQLLQSYINKLNIYYVKV